MKDIYEPYNIFTLLQELDLDYGEKISMIFSLDAIDPEKVMNDFLIAIMILISQSIKET